MARRSALRGDADGVIALRDADGAVLHTAPAPISAALRTMITRLRLADALPQRLGVISSMSGEGTTFVARSLALVLSHDSGEQVCIVDLNWSTPSAGDDVIGDGRGIADALRGEATLDDIMLSFDDPALSVVPAGRASAREIAVFSSSPALTVLLEDVARRFDHVVIDLPAVRSASVALALAARTEGLAVVVRAGVTTDEQVKSTLEQLDGVPVLGVMLNDYRTRVPTMIHRRLAVH